MSVRSILRHRFEAYRPEVEEIAAEVEYLTERYAFSKIRSLSGYVNAGTESRVFRLPSDPSFIVKLPYEDSGRGTNPKQVIKVCIEGLVLGLGARRLSQIVACNDNQRKWPYAAVLKYVHGRSLESLSESERHTISSEHFMGALATFEVMQERMLGLRGVSEDVLRHADGFTILDYKRNPYQTLTDKITKFASYQLLLEHAREGGEVPAYGLLYREVCEAMLGGDMAAAIDAQWQKEGFIIPA